MNEEKLAPHVEELTRVLKEKVEPEQIKEDLEKLVGEFKIPLSEAKRMTIRKYGGSLLESSIGVQYTLQDLLPNQPNVELLCRVVSINEKQIAVDGEEKTIHYGILGDHTMTRPFTAWQECDLEKGDTVRIQNAYTKEWQGEPQIHLGNRVKITKESKDALPPFDPTIGAEEYKISELRERMSSIALIARILSIEEREVDVSGEKKKLFNGMLADETGKVRFTAWHDFKLKENEVIKIVGGYVKSWRGIPDITFDERSMITKLENNVLPEANELEKVKTLTIGSDDYKISELREGLGNIALTARILSIEEREVEVSGEQKKLFNGMLADETGKTRFTAWHDFSLKEGEVIKIENSYVKSWRGIPDITFNERSIITKLEDDILPDAEELEKDKAIAIEALVEIGGGTGIEVNGVILQVKNGSGLIFRCPECKRVVQNGSCMIHGEVRSVPDLRVKAVIDDGTGALNSVFNREITEKLLGKNLEKCQEIAKDAMDKTVIKEELINILTAQPIKVSGNALGDDFGIMLIAKNIEMLEVDTKSEAENLLMELEG